LSQILSLTKGFGFGNPLFYYNGLEEDGIDMLI